MIAEASVSMRLDTGEIGESTLAYASDVGESVGHERVDAHASVTPASPPASPSAPQRIGRYILLENVGSGGMGLVYNAYDPKLNRRVAIKVLRETAPPGSPRHATSRARLVREAQSLAKLTHPNVVTVHDVDTADGKLYMAMEYVEGRSVAEWLRLERPPWREILRVFLDAGRGLVAAHEQGITHRDFKPTNVLIGDDARVRVLDFGLAKHRGDASSDDFEPFAQSEVEVDIMSVVGATASLKLTQAGRIVGTPTYMAPEQYRASGDVGPPTDQFAFAVSLYESLYGLLPFRGIDRAKRQEAAAAGRIEEPPKDSTVPTWIFRVLVRALAPDPADRYPSMQALLTALSADPSRRRRRVLGVAVVALVGLLGTGGTVAAVYGGQHERPCRGARGQWAAMWNGPQRHAVIQALHDTGVPYAEDTANRVVAAIDEYGDRWVEQRTRVCEATRVHGEQSEPLLDARMGCLDDRRNEVNALVRVLSESDPRVVERAVGAVVALRNPSSCASWQPGLADVLPEAPRLRTEVASIRSLIDEANALMLAGRYLRAVEVAERARQRAEIAGHRPTHARARLSEGRALRLAGHRDEARATLEEAVVLASEASDVASEAWGWITLVFLADGSSGETSGPDPLRLAARTAVVRAGDLPEHRLALRLNEGAVDLQLNRLAVAEQAHRDAIEIGEGMEGGKRQNVGTAWMNLGVIAIRRGHHDEAERAFRTALEMLRDLYGPRHPQAGDAAMNLGNALVELQRFGDAEPFLREALEIREGVYGKDHSMVLHSRNSLGVAYMKMSRFEDAEREFRRVLGALGAADDLELRVAVLNNLGNLARHRGAFGEAIALHDEALLGLEQASHGEAVGSLAVGNTLLYRCKAESASSTPPRWVDACTRAHELLVALGEPAQDSLRDLEGVRKRMAPGR